ncbi:MAG: butyrate kinase [Desulfovibrionaceae bacterium]|nr:butyrate kinase [Desulfovibrionaceae bacterium]
MKILTINPGSTSTKIAVFEGQQPLFVETIHHDAAELARFEHVMDQEELRRKTIAQAMDRHGQSVASLDAVIGRGGLMRPIPGGVYLVGPDMLRDLRSCSYGTHASNLGAILAHDLASGVGIPAYIADPVVVDELSPLARYSGHPDIKRRSIFHALNHKAVARRVADNLGRPYEELRLIVAHLGGGVSVGAHELGRVVDVNNALDGDGPFSPERSGGLPAGDVVSWCFAPGATERDVRRRITGQGGCLAYLGTASGMEMEKRIRENDELAREVREAMAYQVAKEIGAMGAVLRGRIDAVILTGGLVHDQELAQSIARRVDFLGPVVRHPGEDEMTALALAALRALTSPETVQTYPPCSAAQVG